MDDPVEVVNVYRDLPEEERRNLRTLLARRVVPKGRSVVRYGEETRSLLFIVEGQIRVLRRDAKGHKVTIAMLREGDFLGEISLVLGTPRSADAVAKTNVVVFELAYKDFIAHTRRYPGLTLLLLYHVSERLRMTTMRITEQTLLSVPERLLSTLRRLGQGEAGSDSLTVTELPTHRELAELCGLTRETVTRTLTRLKDAHLVRESDDGALIVKRLGGASLAAK